MDYVLVGSWQISDLETGLICVQKVVRAVNYTLSERQVLKLLLQFTISERRHSAAHRLCHGKAKTGAHHPRGRPRPHNRQPAKGDRVRHRGPKGTQRDRGATQESSRGETVLQERQRRRHRWNRDGRRGRQRRRRRRTWPKQKEPSEVQG